MRQAELDDSDTPALFNQIQERSRVDYATFDLGSGEKWLSSRLYLFTVILHRMRGLRSTVFVDTQGVTHHFIGLAEPSQVQYALASRYTWLEKAFAKAYVILPYFKIEDDVSLDGINAQELIRNFLREIQQPPLDVSSLESEWVPLKGGKLEHAELLDTVKVEEILQNVLDRSWSDRLDLQGKSKGDQVKWILSFKSQFVAVLAQNQRFEKLIDRQRPAEEMIKTIVEA